MRSESADATINFKYIRKSLWSSPDSVLVPGFLLKLRAELALFSARKRWGLWGGGGWRLRLPPSPPPINAYTFAISLVSSGVGRKLQ